MTDPQAVRAAVDDAHRREWALVLAATARATHDLDLAEECVQEAYVAALDAWVRDGVPANPAAWLTTTARRRAIDTIRRNVTLRAKLPLLIEPEEDAPMLAPDGDVDMGSDEIADERLRLVFTCCHPALAQDAQAALTLRLVCGVPAEDIAAVFLVSEPTMRARLTRAKRKIATARIPFRVPRAAELPDRLRGVLAVVHLLFTTGYAAPRGAELLRADLLDRSVALARVLVELMPDETEARGLLALLLATDARRATRVDDAGRIVALADQDRTRWDRAMLAEADALITGGLRAGPPGRYMLQAAIAAVYADAPTFAETDWPQLLALYDRLLDVWPSPVVRLNRTVALARVAGPQAALDELHEVAADGRLRDYHYLAAVEADLLDQLGDADGAAAARSRARELTGNEAERAYLGG